ncbi:MAG: segregation and condensation protein A [Brevinemataceae bacterium]
MFPKILSSCQIQLKNFEGPLELLDELISSAKLDITEISLSQVTEQYLSYLKAMKEFDIDLASEFFVVAATLIYSKTRKLLPSLQADDQEEILDEQELLKRLKEYRFFRRLARKLEENLDKGTEYFTRGRALSLFSKADDKEIDELTIGDLFRVVIRYRGAFIRKAIPIKRRFVTVEQKIEHLTNMFRTKDAWKCSEIMRDEVHKPDKIASFLGIADMTYHQKTSIVQNHLFDDFQVIKKNIQD